MRDFSGLMSMKLMHGKLFWDLRGNWDWRCDSQGVRQREGNWGRIDECTRKRWASGTLGYGAILR